MPCFFFKTILITEQNYVKTRPTNLFEMKNRPNHSILGHWEVQKENGLTYAHLSMWEVFFLWLMSIQPILK